LLLANPILNDELICKNTRKFTPCRSEVALQNAVSGLPKWQFF